MAPPGASTSPKHYSPKTKSHPSEKLMATTDISHITSQYQKAAHAFLHLRTKVWALYVKFVAALLAEKSHLHINQIETKRLIEGSKLKIVNEVWLQVVHGYDDEEGEVDGEVVVACVLLCLGQQFPDIARMIIETWLYSLPETALLQLDIASTNNIKDDALLKNYEKIVELYVLHVLPKLKDWDYAKNFLRDNIRIDQSRKKAYEQTLDKLQESSKKPKHTKQKHLKSKSAETILHTNGFLTDDMRKLFSHTNGSRGIESTNGSFAQNENPSASPLHTPKMNGSQLIRSSTLSTTSTELADPLRRSTGRADSFTVHSNHPV
ncbi:hypothetical protein G9A89_007596 [Geosiphon pyriformis]|nr:hypothetical protein G9A89_007596 [Geosiphon pyriformis]